MRSASGLRAHLKATRDQVLTSNTAVIMHLLVITGIMHSVQGLMMILRTGLGSPSAGGHQQSCQVVSIDMTGLQATVGMLQHMAVTAGMIETDMVARSGTPPVSLTGSCQGESIISM